MIVALSEMEAGAAAIALATGSLWSAVEAAALTVPFASFVVAVGCWLHADRASDAPAAASKANLA